MSAPAIRLDTGDHVATALRPLMVGETVAVSSPGAPSTICPKELIPAFHKVALYDLAAGEQVRKYGAVIGELTAPVEAGGLIHIHNMRSLRARVVRPVPRGKGATQ